MSVTTETQYDELVRRGREAREQADNVQWVEGDLALEIETLPPTERPRDPETGDFLPDPEKALKRYAEDIDIKYSTLKVYRATAKAWPRVTRVTGRSYRVHQVLAAQEDRFDLIQADMTTREAQKIVRDRTPKANYGHEPGWHELIGQVGDDLIAAEKHLSKVEQAVTRESKAVREKAQQYADIADDVAERLRRVG